MVGASSAVPWDGRLLCRKRLSLLKTAFRKKANAGSIWGFRAQIPLAIQSRAWHEVFRFFKVKPITFLDFGL